MEIRSKMFFGYVVTQILNQPFCDVPPHVRADVCLLLASASRCEVLAVTSTSKNETLLPTIRLRLRSSGLDTLRLETTSTRISVLSP